MDGEVNKRTARIAQDVKRDETQEIDKRDAGNRQTHKMDRRIRWTDETNRCNRRRRDGQHETDNTTHLKELGD